MSKLTILLTYLTMLLVFGLLDAVWLGVVANEWYFGGLSALLREQFITWPWMVFYLTYCGAALYLAVLPSRVGSSVKLSQALLKGAVVGATAYGTYNLTNYSIVADWPLTITLIDWAWGTSATAVVCLIGALTLKRRH
ncbi:DUF2177 family protein [Alteromonas gilva]|uniref:DUF2177 family protein n=1 Tax=Alteromonas gilva TaxID=2987522 RepID=A0ABT5L0C9_9ALTE|nr:DUF2177 family protein [Alteromonas gilva]MDC8829268.1 DUF2177 family protein [Alteromonas gilva]